MSNTHSYQVPQTPVVDEVDLKEVFTALWKGKWLIIVMTALFAVSGVFYALSQPNTYKAEVVMASANKDGQSGLAGMAAQFGGIASLAGINIGGGAGADETVLVLATLKSRQFINHFITKHDLLVPLMASDHWDMDSGKLFLDGSLYDEQDQKWIRDVPEGFSIVPTAWEAYKVFTEIMTVNKEKETGLVTLSIIHHSPIVAQQWAQLLVADLNLWMKNKSINESSHNIEYLNKQLDKTSVAEMKTVFYQLIEEQTKNLMLAEVEDEFSFKTIDPAVIPEEKVGPKRALICILAVFLGGLFSIILILGNYMVRKLINH
ncbi:LPS O-antigen length regulator [Shewanella eurypsychrophilus]|uniref:LPS O-antigen length regulator n=2 Tax=Shewanellaceae TaxID=267890 RepID=A0ABX6VEZ9_9GAMM|nr:LPS O-antigen length regulator [Shewanella sp. YLB-09]QPG60501.1 LPS O-antigen length regulator [Shewanella eurypsychrophilus]